ncbi:MAG: Wzz/FepE/Etk N-terminal domain-containing protein [Pseudomonadota bacterium]
MTLCGTHLGLGLAARLGQPDAGQGSRVNMNKQLSDESSSASPEVRLELTREGIDQVLSVYAQRQQGSTYELSLDDVTRALRRRFRWILGGVLLGVGAAYALVQLSTPLYPVAARALVERSENPGSSRPAGSAFVATQAQLMLSTNVVLRALRALPLPSGVPSADALLADALDWVNTSPISGTDVIAMGYLGPDAEYGAQLLRQLVVAHGDALREARQSELKESIDSTASEIDVLLKESAAIDARVEELRAGKGVTGMAAEAAAAQAELVATYVEQLTEIRNQRIMLENRLAAGGNDLPILDPATRNLQEELQRAESELGRLRLNLTAEHPSVVAAARRVQGLRQQLSGTGAATPQTLRLDIAAAAGLEAELAQIEAQSRRRLQELERYRGEETVLLAEQSRLEDLVAERRRELLDQRLQSRLNGGVDVSVRLISEPAIPSSPTWPKPALTLALGAVLGFAVSLVLATLSLPRQRSNWELGGR